jgi:hypothetical protein
MGENRKYERKIKVIIDIKGRIMNANINLSKLNIIVRSKEESDFVLRLAKRAGYSWRSPISTRGKLTSLIYKHGKGPNGEFVYCFDYRDYEKRILSCLDFGFLENATSEEIEEEIKEMSIQVMEAKELMEMDPRTLKLFLIVR